MIILSGGYGVLHAREHIGDYDKIMRSTDWPSGLLESLLLHEARRRNVSSVVAFAAKSSDYARVVRATPWGQAELTAYLVTIKGVGTGASGKVPRRHGQAFAAFWRGQPADQDPEGTTVERLA